MICDPLELTPEQYDEVRIEVIEQERTIDSSDDFESTNFVEVQNLITVYVPRIRKG